MQVYFLIIKKYSWYSELGLGASVLIVIQDLRQKKALKSSKHGFQDYSEQFNQQMAGRGETEGERE